MTKIKILSAGLIVIAMLGTPVRAHDKCITEPHAAVGAKASDAPTARCIDGDLWIPAPPVGPFSERPSNQPDGVCDVGDNPMIC